MRDEPRWRKTRALLAVSLAGLVLGLSVILGQPHAHSPLIVRGGRALAPSVSSLPTLPPSP